MKIFSSLLENIHENIDPNYLKEKREIKNCLQAIGLASTAILITSIAYSIFGIASIACGAITSPIIFLSLPIGYLAYNAYHITNNLNDIVDHPKEYQKFLGFESIFDKQKIKNKILQNTYCFNWIMEIALSEIAKSNPNHLR